MEEPRRGFRVRLLRGDGKLPLFRLMARFAGPERREAFRRMGATVLLERVD